MKAIVGRDYQMSDDRMLQHSSLVGNLFEEDHTYYNKRYPALFAEDLSPILKASIATAYTMHGDEHARHQISLENSEIKTCVKKFKLIHREIEPIIKRALADNDAAKKMLGIGTLSKMTESPNALVLSMGHFMITLRTYEQALREFGLSDADIKAIVAIETALHKHRDDFDLAKLQRQDMTNERITHFNELWRMVKQIIDSAPAVLPEARAMKYKISPTERTTPESKMPPESH